MTDLAKLVVKLEAEASKLHRELERSNNKLDRFEKKVKRTAANARKAFKVLGAFLAGGVITAGIVRMTKGVIDVGDNLQKLSIKLGASTEALSQYQFVATQTGVEFKMLTQGWQRMTRVISEAAQGKGEAVKVLRELNLSAKDLAKLAPEDQFEVIADAMGKLATQGDRVRVSQKLFDSGAVKLLQTMDLGRDGIRALRDEYDEMGGTMTRVEADSLAAANDAMDALAKSTDGVRQQLAIHLAPVLEESSRWFAEVLPTAINFTKKVLGGLAIGLLNVAKGFALLQATYAKAKSYLPWNDTEEMDAKVKHWIGKAQEFHKMAQLIAADLVDLETGGGGIFNPDTPAPTVGGADPDSGANKKAADAAKKRAEASKAAREAYEAEGRALRESLMKPWEKYTADLIKYQKMYDDQVIGEETRARAFAQAYEELQASNVEWNARVQEGIGINEEMRTKQEAYNDELERLKGLLNDNLITQETFDRKKEHMIKALEKDTDSLKKAAEEMGNVFVSAFEEAITQGGSLGDILKGLEQDIIRIITRLLVTEPLQNAIGNMVSGMSGSSGGGGGFLGELFGAAAIWGKTLLGLEHGGFASAHTPFVIGEAGPELFIPQTSGYVMSNGDAKSMMGGVTVNQYISTPDANSFRLSENQIGTNAAMAIQRSQRNM